METPLSPLDFAFRFAALIFACGSALCVSGCATHHDKSDPISLVVPSPSKPYLMLTADREDVRKGESVELIVTFVNPTKRRLLLPVSSFVRDDGHTQIEHQLTRTYNGYSAGFSSVAIDRCPPSVEYLESGQRKSYRMKWKSDHHYGEGVLELEYQFGWNKDFPPVTLELKTH